MKDVCKKLNISSRTLRYYEELELIKSIRTSKNTEREFTKEEVDKIEEILTLRSLSFSLLCIKEFYQHKIPLNTLLQMQTKYLKDECDEIDKKIETIESAKTLLDEKNNLFQRKMEDESNFKIQQEIAGRCVRELQKGNVNILHNHISNNAKMILKPSMLEELWQEVVAKNGGIAEILSIEQQENNVVIKYTSMIDHEEELSLGFHGTYIVNVRIGDGLIGLSIS